MDFYFEIRPLLLSLLGLCILLVIRKRVSKDSLFYPFWVSGVVFFVLYIFFIIAIALLEMRYWDNYMMYDLDGNGFFEGVEKTKGYEDARSRLLNDTARNFVFITGAVISFLVSVTVLFVGMVARFHKLGVKKL